MRDPREAEDRGAYLAAEARAAGVGERVAEPELRHAARGVVADDAAPPAAVGVQASPRGERAVRVAGEAAPHVEERGALARDAAAGAGAAAERGQRHEEDRRVHG